MEKTNEREFLILTDTAKAALDCFGEYLSSEWTPTVGGWYYNLMNSGDIVYTTQQVREIWAKLPSI